jgi:malate dehydrogenase (oxaloacetate-decarboxylating)
MMTAAAAAVSGHASIHRDPHGAVLPDRAHLVDTATTVAQAAARAAVADGVAPEQSAAQIDEALERTRWRPGY